MESLSENLARVRERIESAAARAHRSAGQITLLAVTKVFPSQVMREAWDLGLREFGENYVQEFEKKTVQVQDLAGARFHLIGHLQSNKSKRAAELFQVVQTIDSSKLARRLNEAGRTLEVMIEVKTSGEESKSGLAEKNLAATVEATRSCANLTLTGLMTVPEWTDEGERSRAAFAHLRELASRYNLPQLSMGMSHDFDVAIEEGATMVRVGTALFGRRQHA